MNSLIIYNDKERNLYNNKSLKQTTRVVLKQFIDIQCFVFPLSSMRCKYITKYFQVIRFLRFFFKKNTLFGFKDHESSGIIFKFNLQIINPCTEALK